jgi:hypothetical protein
MKKIIVLNLFMNLAIGVVFVGLNGWMLGKGFEESFVVLSIVFASIYIIANSLFCYGCGNKVKQ